MVTLANVQNLLAKIITHNETQDGLKNPLVWPLLIGFSGAGKTTVTRDTATAMGAEVEVVLAATTPEHEFLGIPFPEKNGKSYVLNHVLPSWAVRAIERAKSGKRTVIFLDEVDKIVQEERRSMLLTLLAERRIHNTVMPNLVSFVLAMQPARASYWAGETGEALLGRLVAIPINQADAWSKVIEDGKERVAFTSVFENLTHKDVPLPKREVPITRMAQWLMRLWKTLNIDERQIVAHGALPTMVAQEILQADKGNFALSQEEVVKAVAEDLSLIGRISNSELISVCSYMWTSSHTTLELIKRSIEAFILRCTPEEITEGIRSITSYVNDWAHAHAYIGPNGRKRVAILEHLDVKDVVKYFNRALREGGEGRVEELRKQGVLIEEN